MKMNRLFGIHAVQAALEYSPERIVCVKIDGQREDKRLSQLQQKLAKNGIKAEKCERRTLDRFAEGKNHQGVVAEVKLPQLQTEAQLKDHVNTLEQNAFFLVLDHVQDPHNLGACLRSADAAGVHGIIITKDNATGITPTVCKVASGAAETIPVYQVTNLARVLRWMKAQNIWIIGTTGDAEQTIFQADLNVSLALVMGAEGDGMRRLTQQQCDLLVKIPMTGQVESLNVSVAAGIMIYEVLRQRGGM